MHYMQWIYENENHKYYEQIAWIQNLTNVDVAQSIFNIWYREMIGD